MIGNIKIIRSSYNDELTKVKLQRDYAIEALKHYACEDFVVSVKLSISYFESLEEYEKCAHLKKIQDFVEKNLPK